MKKSIIYVVKGYIESESNVIPFVSGYNDLEDNIDLLTEDEVNILEENLMNNLEVDFDSLPPLLQLDLMLATPKKGKFVGEMFAYFAA